MAPPRCALNSKQYALALMALWLVSGVALAQSKPVVQFIATGGTIAMKVDPVTKESSPRFPATT